MVKVGDYVRVKKTWWKPHYLGQIGRVLWVDKPHGARTMDYPPGAFNIEWDNPAEISTSWFDPSHFDGYFEFIGGPW